MKDALFLVHFRTQLVWVLQFFIFALIGHSLYRRSM